MPEFHFTRLFIIVSFEVENEVKVEVDFECGGAFFSLD